MEKFKTKEFAEICKSVGIKKFIILDTIAFNKMVFTLKAKDVKGDTFINNGVIYIHNPYFTSMLTHAKGEYITIKASKFI